MFEWKSKTDQFGKNKIIRVNILTNNFVIASEYLSDINILSAKNLPSQSKAIDIAQGMLGNMNLISDDLDLEKTKTNLYAIKNGTLTPATSMSTAQIIEVIFYQKDIDKIPILYEKANSSNINILVGAGGGYGYNGQIVTANYKHQAVSAEVSTYPIKTSVQAFNELKQGKGYIASYNGTSSNISIDNVFLAYYMGGMPQDFLMPIFVFTGNDNFYAYVPAVTDEWINK